MMQTSAHSPTDWKSSQLRCPDAAGTLQLPPRFILAHTRLPLAVQERFASQVHHRVKQQSHRRLTRYNERNLEGSQVSIWATDENLLVMQTFAHHKKDLYNGRHILKKREWQQEN